MKSSLSLIVSWLAIIGTGSAAETAQVTLRCLSVRFYHASTNFFGVPYTFDLGSNNLEYNPNSATQVVPNGEMAPSVAEPDGLDGYYSWNSATFQLPLDAHVTFHKPPFVDLNGNGIDDFYEISQPLLSIQTMGTLQDDFGDTGHGNTGGEIPVTTTWTRPANSRTGFCEIQAVSSELALTLTFYPVIEFFEYKGTLTYTLGATNGVAAISIAESGYPINTFAGQVQLTKGSPDLLYVMPGAWNIVGTTGGGSLAFDDPVSLARSGTNYVGVITFRNGDLHSTVSDYKTWSIQITDSNDTNGNLMPDLSDFAPPKAPTPPLLSLATSDSGLLLTVTGETGINYGLQHAVSLSGNNWTRDLTFTLSNNVQTLFLSPPATGAQFWRLVTP